MASLSGSSQSMGTSSDYWRRNVDSSTPIPYREGPLEYTPAVLCNCGAKAARFISWSTLNPGLRYLKCARARDGGCDFFRWVDQPTSAFLKQLLLDLRDAVKYWRGETVEAERCLEEARMEIARIMGGAARENQRLQAQVEAAVKFNEDRQRMFVEVRRDVAIMQGEVQRVEEERGRLQARIVKLQKERRILMGALVVFVGLLAAFVGYAR